jgi:hypothetical protein
MLRLNDCSAGCGLLREGKRRGESSTDEQGDDRKRERHHATEQHWVLPDFHLLTPQG